jgi:predicted hydrocarbon binding protein
MATIDEELAIAKQAKAAIGRKSRAETVEVLRKANRMAAEQKTTFASEGRLNNARHKLGLVLPPAIRALEDQASEDRIEKAKGAIDAWVKELEAAKP